MINPNNRIRIISSLFINDKKFQEEELNSMLNHRNDFYLKYSKF